jgi:uncharacterized protein with GYD domain
MPKYLIRCSYTAEGAKGLLKEGGTSRRKAVQELLAKFGGKLETYYFTFGTDDAVLILDLPDDATMAAISLAVTASGALQTGATVLLTPEQIDEASKKSVQYRPPGK